jgi:hypothetical protein
MPSPGALRLLIVSIAASLIAGLLPAPAPDRVPATA